MKKTTRKLINSVQLEQLKEALIKAFGQGTLNVADTYRLSDEILSRTCQRVSPTTLQRILGLVTSNSVPYRATLDILCDYTGYENWERFCRQHEDTPEINTSSMIPDDYGLILMGICLENHHYKSVIDYLEYLPSKYPLTEKLEDHARVAKVSGLLGKYIRISQQTRDELLPVLAQIKQGREYFYQTFIDMEHLDSYYSQSLNTYLMYSEKTTTTNGLSDYLFVNGIQMLNHIEKNEIKRYELRAKEFFRTVHDDMANKDYCSYVQPLARYYNLRVIYDHFSGTLNEKKLAKFLDTFQQLIDTREVSDFTLMQALHALYTSEKHLDLVKFYQHNLEWVLKCPAFLENIPLIHSYAWAAHKKTNQAFPLEDLSLLSPQPKTHLYKYSFNYVNTKVQQLVGACA